MSEGRRKKEEGRGKKEEGRRKKKKVFPMPNALFAQCPVWPMPND
ncbi:hypothetical protein [Microcoleus vaginatus]